MLTGSLTGDLVAVYAHPVRDTWEHLVALAYVCRISGGENHPGHNVGAVTGIDKEDLDDMDIAFDHRQMLADTFRKLG